MSIPLGPTNTPHTAFPLALHQTLAPVRMFGITISTNEERDAEGQIILFLAIPKTEREQIQLFRLSPLLYRASVRPKPANFIGSSCTTGVISHPTWGSVWSNADAKSLEDLTWYFPYYRWDNCLLLGRERKRGGQSWAWLFDCFVHVSKRCICMCKQQRNSSSPSYHHLRGTEPWDWCPYA